MSKQRRFVDFTRAQIRQDGEDGKIRGTAVPYFTLSVDLGGFREMFLPGAFPDPAANDPVATFNHNYDNILGRHSAGTLVIRDGEDALHYEIDPPDTTVARDLKVSLERRDVQGSSFTFAPSPGGELFAEVREASTALESVGVDGDALERAMTVVAASMAESDVVAFQIRSELYEVAPVVNPAYAETEARQTRSAFKEWRERRRELTSKDYEIELALQRHRLLL